MKITFNGYDFADLDAITRDIENRYLHTRTRTLDEVVNNILQMDYDLDEDEAHYIEDVLRARWV